MTQLTFQATVYLILHDREMPDNYSALEGKEKTVLHLIPASHRGSVVFSFGSQFRKRGFTTVPLGRRSKGCVCGVVVVHPLWFKRGLSCRTGKTPVSVL